MGSRTRLTDRDKGYERLVPALFGLDGANLSVEVGIIDDGPALDGGASLAEIAAVQEFGSSDGRIPARPFLRTTFDGRKGLLRAAVSAALRRAIDGTLPLTAEGILGAAGDALAGAVRETISAGIGPANAPSTLRRKRGSTPLIDTGRLLAAITVRVVAGSGGGTTRRQRRRRGGR